MPELAGLPDASLERHVAILATSDAGKTYAAKGEVERLLGMGRRVCVIDPTGVWYGLRLSPDGDTPSPFDVVIFGGDHADVALQPGSGARLAQLVAAGDFSCILDVSRLTVGERTRLFADFAEALAAHNRAPLHLVVDEAHLFMPQGRVQDPISGRMLHAGNHLVSAGRALGIRVMLLSQRPAKLHKDSLTQVQTLVAMLNIAPQDRKAVADWILSSADGEQGRAIVASLPGLQVGDGWVWAPRLDVLERVHFRPIATFDSSATPEGSAARPTVKLAALDLGAIEAALADPAVAPPEASAPKPAVTSRKALEEAERRGYERGLEEGRTLLRSAAAHLSAIGATLVDQGDALSRTANGVPADPPTGVVDLKVNTGAPPAPEPEPVRPAPRTKAAPKPDGEFGTAARKLVAAELGFPDRGRFLTNPEISILAGLNANAGNTRLGFKQIAEALAAGGSKIAAVTPASLTARALVEVWTQKLGAPADRILRLLYEAGPQTAESAASALGLSATAGHTRGGWKALRSAQLIETSGAGVWTIALIIRELRRLRP